MHNTAAYFPFSYGPAGCVVKQLALMEIRAVTTLILQRFDVRFAETYDPARWEKDMNDYFVLLLGELPTVITPRKAD